MKTYKINLIENRPIINILGEICWGFHVNDFEKKIGVKKNVVENLLNRFLQVEKSEITETQISDAEFQIIKNALSEVENEIEEWEFETRIGVTLEEVKSLAIFNTN